MRAMTLGEELMAANVSVARRSSRFAIVTRKRWRCWLAVQQRNQADDGR
jgi:hypothetical protein